MKALFFLCDLHQSVSMNNWTHNFEGTPLILNIILHLFILAISNNGRRGGGEAGGRFISTSHSAIAY